MKRRFRNSAANHHHRCRTNTGTKEIVMADDLKRQNNSNNKNKRSKKRRLLQGSESKDRLSSLHDSIIVDRILSLLPFREVVRTELLSKRWKSLWIGVSSFDISDSGGDPRDCNTTSCWNSAERVVLFRNRSIKQFKLSLTSFIVSTYPRVQSIISSLSSHNILHLDISLCVEDKFTLPDSIFDCRSLSILKLSIQKEEWIRYTLELPVHVSLPCLKVLQLRNFEFPNAKSIQKLISCCPVLEELALLGCTWKDLSNFTISSPSIKRFTVDFYYNSCNIIIEAPALECFEYTGFLSNHFCFNRTSSSSFKSFIHIANPSFTWPPQEVKIFQGLEENVVSLTISSGSAPHFLSLVGDNDIDLPVLQRLKYLNLMTSIDLKGLLRLFNLFPNLETLEFSKTISAPGFERLLQLNSLPNCFSSSLRVMIFQKFNGHSYEYSFLKDFMERAVSLERINIFLSEDIVNKQRTRKVLKKLSTRFNSGVIINVE